MIREWGIGEQGSRGAGEQGSRGAGEQGRVVVSFPFSPVASRQSPVPSP
ncbi:MAG: hypothetical protein V7K57_11860 [Nostoc sp.]